MKNKKISKNELIKQVISLGNSLGRRPKKRDNNYLYFCSRKIFGSWNNLMKSASYTVRFYQKINSIDLSEDFAYFLGLLVTDGHIYYNNKTKHYKVAIYTSYPEERDMLARLIKDLFNYKIGVSSRMYGFNKKPNYEIRISSKNLAKIIITDFNIHSGAKSLNSIIPKKIKNSNIEIKKAFLRGVIDGDGSISEKSIKIASGSIKFLEGLKELLKQLNIHSGKVIRDNKKTNTFSVRINRHNDLIKIKTIYNSRYHYKRKKDIIDKI